MRFKNALVNKLAKQHGVDPRVVRLVVDYPFLFTKRKIADIEDDRPIRLRYLGAFVQKQYKNENKTRKDSDSDLQ